MRILSIVLIALFIMACNNSAKKNEASQQDTASKVKQMPVTPAVTTDTTFTGFGTEPFWAVYVINENKIVFHPADGADVEVPFAPATGGPDNTMLYKSASGSNSIEISIAKKSCSDGMSEKTHRFSVSVMVNQTRYAGCGREGNE